jgi:hypothetical protein
MPSNHPMLAADFALPAGLIYPQHPLQSLVLSPLEAGSDIEIQRASESNMVWRGMEGEIQGMPGQR